MCISIPTCRIRDPPKVAASVTNPVNCTAEINSRLAGKFPSSRAFFTRSCVCLFGFCSLAPAETCQAPERADGVLGGSGKQLRHQRRDRDQDAERGHHLNGKR